MNELVEVLKNNDFPVLFRDKDILNLDFNRKNAEKLFKEAISKKWIKNVYENIYTLSKEYRKTLISGCVLSQMIEPESYTSSYYVLSMKAWIPEFVYTVTNITERNKRLVDTNGFGRYEYEDIFNNLNNVGIIEEENDNGKYKIAKPLRALCDLLIERKELYDNMNIVCNVFRIDYGCFDELNSGDFDELQGNFNVLNIENFLENTRKELRL